MSESQPGTLGLGNLTDEQEEALKHARHLVEHGVPIFIAKPALDKSGQWVPNGGHQGCGYWLPTEWQQTEADASVLDRWRPGDALCAVMGHRVDAIDVDVHRGGGKGAFNGSMPRSYGTQSTPSGGTHDLIATLGVHKRLNLLPGVDLQAGDAEGEGRGFIFLAPTRKLSKATGEVSKYAWTTPPNLDPLLAGEADRSGTVIRQMALTKQAKPVAPSNYTGPEYADLTAEQQAWADRWVEERAESWRVRLEDALDWPEGQEDENGRGWEAMARDWAWVVAGMAAAPWTALDEDSALALHDDVLPVEMARDAKCAEKWYDGIIEKSVEQGVTLPPWDGFTDLESPSDDGAAVEIESNRPRVFPSPASPMPNARKLVERLGSEPLRTWRGSWWHYQGGVYQERSDALVDALLYQTFEHAVYQTKNRMMRWDPNPSKISAVRAALSAVTIVGDHYESNTWVGGHSQWEREEFINCTNGLFHPSTGVFTKHTPDYFSINQVPYAYDADSECPQWEAFLRDVLSADQDAIDLLQEWFGYVISGRLDQAKMMYLFGPKRSGKGTVMHVLANLVGEANVASPTLAAYAADFGLQSLIGKSLALTDDARQGKSLDIQTLTERLLTITAGGRIDVPRKYKEVWGGILPARIMIASNDTPWFNDPSGAIVGRMVLLRFKKSYFGKEDTGLLDRLLTELPGILNWALVGLDRLDERDKKGFTEPKESKEMLRELADEASPLSAFINERCVLDPEQWVASEDLLDEYNTWRAERRWETVSPTKLGHDLRAVATGVRSGVRRGPKGNQKYGYAGIRLAV